MSDGELRVRLALPSDEAFVLALAERFGLTRAPWRELDEVVLGTRRQLAAALRETRANEAVFVAVDADDVEAGFAYIVTHHDFFTGDAHGHLSEIATSCDGKGVGSRLMDACESWSRERGYRYLSLNVNDSNENARRFYARRAYIPEYRHLIRLL